MWSLLFLPLFSVPIGVLVLKCGSDDDSILLNILPRLLSDNQTNVELLDLTH